MEWPTLNEAVELSFKNKRRIRRRMCSKAIIISLSKPLTTLFREAIEERNSLYAVELIRNYKIDLEKEVEGTSWLPLALSAMKNDTNTVDSLITLGSKIEGKSGPLEFTALHASILGHCFDTFKLLLELGANPFCQNRNLTTPLHLSTRMECIEIRKILLELYRESVLKEQNAKEENSWFCVKS